MKTIAAFYQSTRTKFPDLTEKADRQHIKYWDELPTEAQELYIWFESVSRAPQQTKIPAITGILFVKNTKTFLNSLQNVLYQI